MKTLAFAIFDKKVASYGPPFFTRHEGEASRMVRSALMDRQSSLAQFPTDFALYKIGAYDDQGGILVGHNPEFLLEVASLVEKADQQELPLLNHKE